MVDCFSRADGLIMFFVFHQLRGRAGYGFP